MPCHKACWSPVWRVTGTRVGPCHSCKSAELGWSWKVLGPRWYVFCRFLVNDWHKSHLQSFMDIGDQRCEVDALGFQNCYLHLIISKHENTKIFSAVNPRLACEAAVPINYQMAVCDMEKAGPKQAINRSCQPQPICSRWWVGSLRSTPQLSFGSYGWTTLVGCQEAPLVWAAPAKCKSWPLRRSLESALGEERTGGETSGARLAGCRVKPLRYLIRGLLPARPAVSKRLQPPVAQILLAPGDRRLCHLAEIAMLVSVFFVQLVFVPTFCVGCWNCNLMLVKFHVKFHSSLFHYVPFIFGLKLWRFFEWSNYWRYPSHAFRAVCHEPTVAAVAAAAGTTRGWETAGGEPTHLIQQNWITLNINEYNWLVNE